MELRPLKLLFNQTAEDMFPWINLVMVSWCLLLFAPYWSLTPNLTLIAPLLLSVVYVGTVFSLVLWPQPNNDSPADFTSLQGVVDMFQDPTAVFAGWVHFVVFDALVGRMIVLDAISRGSTLKFHIFGVIPCLLFTFLLGPTGFLGYMILREIFLPTKDTSKLKIL